MPTLIAYLLIFLVVGVGFVFINLLIGSLLRPQVKNEEKDIPYECGEEPIGTAWVQFDLRFYVVALLFVIFDVELVFFFPWATLFGKLNAVSVPTLQADRMAPLVQSLVPYAEAGSVLDPGTGVSAAWLIFAEMAIFLSILLLGYAYLWRRGDLNWVRASSLDQARQKKSLPVITN